MDIFTISRFAKVGNYVSYCRKVSRKWLSNDKVKGKGNKKSGNKYLAWAYSEAAHIEYKNILIATDGLTQAKAAVTEATAITKRTGAHVIVLSAMRDETERAEATKFANEAADQAKKEGVSAEAVTPAVSFVQCQRRNSG